MTITATIATAAATTTTETTTRTTTTIRSGAKTDAFSIPSIPEQPSGLNTSTTMTATDDQSCSLPIPAAAPSPTSAATSSVPGSGSSAPCETLGVSQARSHHDQCTPPTADAVAESDDIRTSIDSTAWIGRETELRQLHDVYNAMKQSHRQERQTSTTTNRRKSSASKAERDVQQHLQDDPQSNSAEAAKPQVPAVVISGSSGTGKSALVLQFIHELQSHGPKTKSNEKSKEKSKSKLNSRSKNHNHNICFCQGKFQSQSHGDSPFGALYQVIQNYILQIEGDAVRQRIQQHIAKAERRELCKVLPCLKQLLLDRDDESRDFMSLASSRKSRTLGNTTASTDGGVGIGVDIDGTTTSRHGNTNKSTVVNGRNDQEGDGSNGDQGNMWNRSRYLIHTFFQVICDVNRPLILFFDDLQWGSEVCLNLFASLALDPMIHSCMFVGTIRLEGLASSKSQQTHLSTVLQNMAQTRQVTRIELDNFTEEQTYQWVSRTLKRDRDQHPSASAPSPSMSPREKRNDEEDDDCRHFASILHQKTNGNIFFLRQALEELERKQVLQYSQHGGYWEWNDATTTTIAQSLSNTAVEAVQAKIESYPSHRFRYVLCVASYTQTMFDIDVLHMLLQKLAEDCNIDIMFGKNCSGSDSNDNAQLTPSNFTLQALTELLEDAVLEGLLANSIGEQTYRFVHDRIQQGAQSIVPEGQQRTMLRYRIGTILYDIILAHERGGESEDDTGKDNTDEISAAQQPFSEQNGIPDWFYFCAADHLNSVQMKKDRWYMAKLNHTVGSRAQQISALPTASKYFQIAFDELERIESAQSPWHEDYDLTLCLHVQRAEIELALGNYSVGTSLANVVLDKAKTTDDKLSTQYNLADALGRQNLHKQSLTMIVDILQSSKALPKRFWVATAMTDLLYIRRYFERTSNSEFMQLPLMTNPKKIMAMKFLHQGTLRAAYCRQSLEAILFILKSLRMTIKHGLSKYSSLPLLNLGCIFGDVFSDQLAAERYLDLGAQILRCTDGKSLRGWLNLTAAHRIHPFSADYDKMIDVFQRGCRGAMEVGDFESGFMNWELGIIYSYFSGFPLKPLIVSFENIRDSAQMYNMEFVTATSMACIDFYKTLVGEKPLDWGEVEEVVARMPASIKDMNTSENHQIMFELDTNAQLCMYFRSYHSAYLLIKKAIEITPLDQSYLMVCARGYFAGIACAGMYRMTKESKYKKELKERIQIMKRKSMSRGLNGIHRFLCLEAELLGLKTEAIVRAATKGGTRKTSSISDSNNVKIEKAIRAYDIAIKLSAQAMHHQDAGLACELLGDFCVRVGRSEVAREYYPKACAYYELWQSFAKVEDVKERCDQFLSEEGLQRGRGAIQASQSGRESAARPIVSGGYSDRCHNVTAGGSSHHSKEDFTRESMSKSVTTHDIVYVLNSLGGSQREHATHESGRAGSNGDDGDAVSVLTKESGLCSVKL